ncbi:oxysterol-binding protein-related protein 8 isoform X4 [Folsomia candida]|uniref:oxysterol-binding protein-related protein 8 isoform X4 n=1 Tax=Folsomia candida TaxID=158441 RepID=UPI0016054A25|nr:oxysterol-binding protein-related protein 8 isoform X4 [Folsomia candida]
MSEPVSIPSSTSNTRVTPKTGGGSISHSPQHENSSFHGSHLSRNNTIHSHTSYSSHSQTPQYHSSSTSSNCVAAATTIPATTCPYNNVNNMTPCSSKMTGLVTSSSSDFSHLLAELKRKPSLHVLPKFGSHSHNNGSSESLNKSPHSPGSVVGEENADDSKELSYKAQRKNYRKEKQRVAKELTTALMKDRRFKDPPPVDFVGDPSITILSGTLKVRGKLKGWTKLWAVLKPGSLLFYKGKVKSSHWVATVLLSCCKVIERPSKKDGFCFKLFHPLEQSVWSTRGPGGETIGAVVQPLPTTYLICRAPTADEGKCWMDGLELALTCSSLLVRSPRTSDTMDTSHDAEWCPSDAEENNRTRSNSEKSDSDTSHIEEAIEHDSDDDDMYDENEDRPAKQSIDDPMSAQGLRKRRKRYESNQQSFEETTPAETCYAHKVEEEFAHTTGEHSEVLGDENKSLLWFLVKQVRPGMDLSRVVLPTFILEPRSFLDKLTDYYYHADLLSQAVLEDDAFIRMKSILRWYLSGFYKKPKGLKKPYNPILGETFRCYWEHPTGSRTFYLAEQVSHHPPVSAFYVSNKKDGFVISSAILAKSKFYGNSTSAILEGQATLTLLPRGEAYVMTMPYAHCKGILVGTLSMELGGTVSIVCEKTGYFSELEFKLKGFLGRSDTTNTISGKIKLGRETVATVEGHWDNKIVMKDRQTGCEEVLWEVNDKIRARRLKRYTVPLDKQELNESERKWIKVTEAIVEDNQEAATTEKTKLEDEQRKAVTARVATNSSWVPKNFLYDGNTWRYKFEDLRPWDVGNDLMEFERDYMVQVHQRHKTPIMRASSLISVDSKVKTLFENLCNSEDPASGSNPLLGSSLSNSSPSPDSDEASGCDIRRDIPPDQVVPAFHQRESNRQLIDLLRQLLARQIQQSEQIEELRTTVASIQAKLAKPKLPKDPFPVTNTVLAVVFAVAMQVLMIIYWFGDGKLMPDISRRKM